MADSSPTSHPPLAWMDFLDRIEQAVRQSLELAVEPAAVPMAGAGAGAAALQTLDDGLTRWQACLDGAAADTVESAALAATEEAALAGAIQSVRESREKLAKWLKPAV
jgi:hypothetical protein